MSTDLIKSAENAVTALNDLEKEYKDSLPHLYGDKFYTWQRKIWESTNEIELLTAASQIGKSSILIRSHINWATDKALWPKLWKTPPIQFWYLYPDYGTATREFETKWVPEFLPRGKMKDDPVFGWKAEYEKKEIKALRWNSGLITYFLAYAQMTKAMQASSVSRIDADEEIPVEHVTELRFRLIAKGGYFRAGFTATLSQEFWRLVMEEKGEHEEWKEASKTQVTLFECRKYEDGTDSIWTEEKIQRAISACTTKKEYDRRILGKFVKSDNLRYPNFQRIKHVKKSVDIPSRDWLRYCGVDIGSGGERGHSAAITFIAVRPDFQFARVYRHWNSGKTITSSGDIFQMFLQMRGSDRLVGQFYDHSSVEFGTIATRAHESFIRAEKGRLLGDNILNTLFAKDMMVIDDLDECQPLVLEIESLTGEEKKQSADDDSVDSLRYGISTVPFDWSIFAVIEPDVPTEKSEEMKIRCRTENDLGLHNLDEADVVEELQFWQNYLDA